MVVEVDVPEKLLKPNEVTVCKKLASSGDADSQRASALLAIHSGETQVIAAEASGLTLGQVRYILRRFRELRLGAFSSSKPVARPKAKVVQKPVEPEVVAQQEEAEKPSKDKKSKKKAKPEKKSSKKADKPDKPKKDKKKDKSDKDKKPKKKNKKKK